MPEPTTTAVVTTPAAATPAAQYASKYDDPAFIAAVKQTVCKGASDAQLTMFMEVCKSTKLNPFLKEIWFVAETGAIMAARDGYLRVANEHPMFDGMETRVERDEKGIPIKAVCSVWRKDRGHAVTAEAYYNEYAKPAKIWQQYKSAMISKVAEVLALKRSFSINGCVTEEEIGNYIDAVPYVEPPGGSKEAADAVAERTIKQLNEGKEYTAIKEAGTLSPEEIAKFEAAQEEKQALLRAIMELLRECDDKQQHKILLAKIFGTKGWTPTTKLDNDVLRAGLQNLRTELDAISDGSEHSLKRLELDNMYDFWRWEPAARAAVNSVLTKYGMGPQELATLGGGKLATIPQQDVIAFAALYGYSREAVRLLDITERSMEDLVAAVARRLTPKTFGQSSESELLDAILQVCQDDEKEPLKP